MDDPAGPPTHKPRILLADDHVLVAQGIQQLLQANLDCEIVGLVADGRALVAEAERLAPDIAIVDISLPLLNGLDACRVMKKMNPGLKLIALTMHAEERYVRAAFQVGCAAYVVKQDISGDLLRAVQEVLRGRTYLSPSVAQIMVHRAVGSLKSSAMSKGAAELTRRQRDILQLLAQGKTVREISDLLALSVTVVEHHTKKIKNHLGLRSTADLTEYALRHGLIELH